MVVQLRNENKYYISKSSFLELSNSLNVLMDKDSHIKEEGYLIRSLYFDDYQESNYQDVIDGNNERSKYRIRIYNEQSDVVHLERKSKVKGLVHKDSIPIDKDICMSIIKDNQMVIKDDYPELLKKFLIDKEIKLLKPSAIVEYYRIPYICDDGNVRITYDYNLSASSDYSNFLNKDIKLSPLYGQESSILEVKYDEYIPSYISDILKRFNLTRQQFPKYVLCRQRVKEGI